MNGTRMKKILLWFLLICNLVLLAVSVFFGARQQMRLSSQSRDAITLMEKNGVSVDDSIYKKLLESGRAYTLKTDTEERDSFCEELLGESADAQAQSGGTVSWNDDKGSLTWNTSGTFSGTVDMSVSASNESAAVKKVRNAMKRSGMDMSYVDVTGSSDMSNVVVTAKKTLNGVEITDCKLTFTFDDLGKATIEGQWCFGEPEKVVMDELDDSSPADILMAVAEANSSVTQITDVEQVYTLSNKSGGRFTLIPCWKVTTDQGDIVIDPTTGQEASTADTVPDTSGYTETEIGITDGVTDGTTGITDGSTVTDDETTTDGDMTIDDGTTDGTTDGATDGTSGVGEWDPSTGTDKSDPEIPDENGIYG